MAQNNKQNNNGFWQVDLQEFVCGWGASFINIAITYPMYKIMFRQVNGLRFKEDIFFTKQKKTIFKINRFKIHLMCPNLDASRSRDEISRSRATT